MTESNIPFQIIELIKHLDSKIPQRLGKQTNDVMFKRELCLWNMQVIEEECPVFKLTDHVTRMKVAYLTEGCLGIWNYVKKYVQPSHKTRIKHVIMLNERGLIPLLKKQDEQV
jgi:hypothetical protein